MAADAVDLTLDTAGTIGPAVGSILGFGNSDQETAEETQRRELNNATDRVETSLHEEAEAVKSTVKPRKAKSHSHKPKVAKTATKPVVTARAAKPNSKMVTAKRQSTRKVAS